MRWDGALLRDGRRRHGAFLGIPYDFRPLTAERIKRGLWNPGSTRIPLPKVWGWGFGINLHEVARRMRLIRRTRDPHGHGDGHRERRAR